MVEKEVSERTGEAFIEKDIAFAEWAKSRPPDCSSVWDDGDETAEMLDGISVTDVDSVALKMHTGEDMMCGSYYGDHLAIICGNCAQMGDDAGELVISDPVVVEVLA